MIRIAVVSIVLAVTMLIGWVWLFGAKAKARLAAKYPAPGKPKYLAVYEFETDDIEKTLEAHAKNVEAKYAAGRKSPFAEVVSKRFCKVR